MCDSLAQTDVLSLGRGVGSPWHKPMCRQWEGVGSPWHKPMCRHWGGAWGLLGTNHVSSLGGRGVSLAQTDMLSLGGGRGFRLRGTVMRC